METDGFLTVLEAAQEAGMTESGIRDAMRRGALKYSVQFGVRVIHGDDIAAFRATVRMGRPRKSGARQA